MRIGYARVSTEDQRLDMQTLALKKANCDKVFSDHGISGSTISRPGLDSALAALKKGDTLVVWRLDRLGRSLMNLVQMVDMLGKRGVDFVSLNELIDTSTSGGRLVFHMMAALSEFERTLISERTRAGMDAARRKGQHVGRPPSLSHDEIVEARTAVAIGGEDIPTVAARYNVSPRTMRKWLGVTARGLVAS